MAIGPDFYGANRFTAYPFVRQLEPMSRVFIDAMVTVENEYVGTDIRLVYAVVSASSPRQIEIVSGTTVLIARTDPVSVETFGAYEVLTVSGDEASAVFVISPSEFDGVYDDADGLVLVEHVLGGLGETKVEAVHAEGTEVAGPGQAVTFVLGTNMEAEVSGSSLILHARYRNDGPCSPIPTPRNPGVLTINGVGPDEDNNFQITGQTGGVFLVDTQPEDNGIRLINTGRACCDCDDYERLFNYMATTHERLESIRSWQLSNQTRYTGFNNYLKFLLRMEIVDANFSEDWEAECNA